MSNILVIVFLVFLFQGNPSVFDKLHDYAMRVEICK